MRFTSRFGANFLWHMLAVAKIGYDSEYADKYSHTVAYNDLAYLVSKKEHLVFAEGEGGALSGFFTTMPAWLRVDTKAQFERYFEVLQASLNAGRLQPFVGGYPDADWSDRFFGEFLARDQEQPELRELAPTASELADIYLRSLETYRNDVWADAEVEMQQRSDELNQLFAERDYIAAWEQFLGMQFAADAYEIVLCHSNKNGPDYNSLGYSGNLIYYDKPFDRTWQFVSHEIGTHLLIDIYFKLAGSGEYDHRKLYSAYETLAMFYNRIILDVDQLAYDIPQMNDEWHLERYGELYSDGIDPEELIIKTLK